MQTGRTKDNKTENRKCRAPGFILTHRTDMMKIFFDLLPVLLFFVAYKWFGLYAATGVAIAASIAQIVWLLATRRKVDAMLWLSLAIIVIMGGATLVSHNAVFIKWKLTVLYWLYAGILLGGELLLGKNFLRMLLDGRMQLPDAVWRRLNLSWVLFFTAMGGLNLFVASHFSTDIWVDFKLFGSMGLMLLFVLAQGMVISRYMEETPSE